MKTYEVFVCRAYGICKLVGKSVFSEERIAIRGGLSPKQKNFGSVSWKRHCYCSRGQMMISRTQVVSTERSCDPRRESVSSNISREWGRLVLGQKMSSRTQVGFHGAQCAPTRKRPIKWMTNIFCRIMGAVHPCSIWLSIREKNVIPMRFECVLSAS